jgi:hypothetical protein
MEDNLKLWSSVGSAGTVDIADTDKVVFSNSIVALRGITVVAEPARFEALVGPVRVLVHAVVRYGVTSVDGVANPERLNYGLKLRFRGGAGQVVAKLIQVEIASGIETPLVMFEASGNQQFVVGQALGSPNELDFVNNAYYVELRLAATTNLFSPLIDPPAVSVVQLFLGNT